MIDSSPLQDSGRADGDSSLGRDSGKTDDQLWPSDEGLS
jgi:hypothetical protein